jgi:hypothetical protein
MRTGEVDGFRSSCQIESCELAAHDISPWVRLIMTTDAAVEELTDRRDWSVVKSRTERG